MGSGTSVSPENDSFFFAYQVIISEYERLKSLQEKSAKLCFDKDVDVKDNNDEEDKDAEINFQIDSPTKTTPIFDRLEELYTTALLEWSLPLEECLNPFVMIYKYSHLSAVDLVSYHDLIIKKITERSKANTIKKEVRDDSKSFGGTAEDSRAEKEAAALLRGVDNSDNQNETEMILRSPCMENNELKLLLRQAGVWRKYFGNECYMYIHVLTKEVLSIRPDSYEDEIVAEKTVEQEVIDQSNGLQIVLLKDMHDEVRNVVLNMKKTPLILDCSVEQNARTFYSYKAILEDVSCLMIPFGKSGIKRSDIVERCRKSLVLAMKTGGTFVLYLGQVNIEQADWKKKLCHKDSFPSDLFVTSGQKLLQPTSNPRYKALYREADLEQGQAIVRDGFCVVVITSLSPFEYEGKLEDSIPLGYMHPLYIE